MRARSIALMLAALAGAATLAMSPQAQARDAGGTIHTCSRYGHGCLTAPTRQGRVEREVRMPGGTWIGCKRDCRETLREEALDFFETLNERAPSRTR